MDVKKKNTQKSHIHTLTKSFISKIPFHLFSYPIIFSSALLFARAVFLGHSAPFGLAVAAALGTSRFSLPALLGATLGYLSVYEKINSLKYIACLILVFTAHFVFSGTSLKKSRYFIPLSVIVPTLCINFVFLADGGFEIFTTALSVLEILFSALAAIFLSRLENFTSKTPKELSPALIMLAVAVVSSLCSFSFMGRFSVGRIFSFLFIMLTSFRGGFGIGAASGVLMGSAISLSLVSAEFAIIFGMFGIIIALLFPLGKPLAIILSYIFVSCICACLDPALLISVLLEFPVAVGLFFLFEPSFTKHTRRFFTKPATHGDIHLRRYATERLNCASAAFRNLGNTLSELHKKEDISTLSDVRTFFEKNAHTFCKNCSLSSICWERDYHSTRDAFTKAGNAIITNGVLSPRDFPIYFSSRCLNTENFVNSTNREIFAMRCRQQLDEKTLRSRDLLKRQYSDIASFFSGLSLDISDNARFDEEAEAEISDILIRHGILCDAAAYRDCKNHINIHICGRDLQSIISNYDELLPLFEKACKTRLTSPEYTPSKELDDIVIRERPKFRAVFGAAVKSRNAADCSGDSGSLIYPSNGHLALLLSDGMGSGRLAAVESARSVKLLSDLLKSGLSPREALSNLQAALAVRLEFTGTFATLDLFSANLFSGEAEIYKLGGAPTYIKRGNKISRITSQSLPAGVSLSEESRPDVTNISLSHGDYVIMTSDGIADGNDDVNLLDFLSSAVPSTPKHLADEILAFSLSHYKKNDDMTVAVILIENEY